MRRENHPVGRALHVWLAGACCMLAAIAQEAPLPEAAVPEFAGRGQVRPGAETASPAPWEVDRLRRILKAAPRSCVFEDDLDNAANWEFTGLWHHQIDSACATAAPGYQSAPGAMAFNDETACSYDTGLRASGYATMKTGKLIPGDALAAVLVFHDSLELERAFDTAFIEISADGGPWTPASFVRKVSDTVWGEEIVDISQYIDPAAPKTIRVRFGFDTFDSQFNDYAGWYVDDVSICTTTVPEGFSGVYINSIAVQEKDFARVNATFTVTVDPPSANPFGLRYSTVDETAKVEDGDYEAAIGTLTFAAGETEKTVTVTVIGDPYPEGNETFLVELSDLAGGGGTVVLGAPVGTGTIEDDDFPSTVFLEEFETVDRWLLSGNWHLSPGNRCLAEDAYSPASAVHFGIEAGLIPPPPPPVYSLVEDGGFENGTPNGFWVESSANHGTPLCDVTTCPISGDTGPRSGEWWAWFGRSTPSTDETSSVEQSFIIPSIGNAELTFYAKIFSDGTPGNLSVYLDGSTLFEVTEADAAAYTSYQEVVIDVSAFADDMLHILRFEGFTEKNGVTTFFVDDVSLTAGGGAEGEGEGEGEPYIQSFCAYLPNSSGYLELAQDVTLAPAVDIRLKWFDYLAMEPDNDRYFVEISDDGGLNWTQVFTSSETDPDWNENAVDISAYSGRAVRFRFGFEANGNIEDIGWIIDQVRVESVLLPADYSNVSILSAQAPEGSGPDDLLSLPEARVFAPLLSATGFAAFDTDGNGGVSREELEAAASDGGAVASALLAVFDTLDIGDRVITFTIQVDPPNSRDINVRYFTSDLSPQDLFTAQAGPDYGPTDSRIRIPADSATATVSVPLAGDAFAEKDERFRITIEAASANAIVSNGTALGTIENDDTISLVTISSISVLEGNNGELDADGTFSARFRIDVAPPSNQPVTVHYRTVEGTALRSIDYLHNEGTLEIAAGEDRAFVLVRIRDDQFPEEDETVFMEVSDPSINATFGTDTGGQPLASVAGTATILNDDDYGVLWSDGFEFVSTLWTFNGNWHVQDNSQCLLPTPGYVSPTKALVYNVEADCDYDVGTIPIAYLNVDLPIPATALDPRLMWSQFVDLQAPILFGLVLQEYSGGAPVPGQYAEFVLTHPEGGEIGAWHEEYIPLTSFIGKTVRIGFALNTFGVGANPEPPETVASRGWYLDNISLRYIDAAGVSVLSVEDVAQPEGNIGAANAVVRVNFAPAPAAEASFFYTTLDETATAGEDYVGASQAQITVPAGARSATIEIPILGDFDVEATESFEVIISDPSANLFALSNRGRVTITNEDFPQGTIFGTTGAAAPAQLVQSSITNPPEVSTIATYDSVSFSSGDFAGYDFNSFFAWSPADNHLYELNTSTGLRRAFAALTPISGGHTWAGLAWHLQEGRFYALSSNGADAATLYTIGQGEKQIVGSDSNFYFPMDALYRKSRTQAIYLASELSGIQDIDSVYLHVTQIPGGPLENWTIRLKQTAQTQFAPGQPFDNSDWTTVYQNNEQVQQYGWVKFSFSAPYTYTAGNNLIVEFSYCNANQSSDGYVSWMSTPTPRSAFYESNLGESCSVDNPLNWTTVPYTHNGVPTIKLGALIQTKMGDLPPTIARPIGLAIHPTTGALYTVSRPTGSGT